MARYSVPFFGRKTRRSLMTFQPPSSSASYASFRNTMHVNKPLSVSSVVIPKNRTKSSWRSVSDAGQASPSQTNRGRLSPWSLWYLRTYLSFVFMGVLFKVSSLVVNSGSFAASTTGTAHAMLSASALQRLMQFALFTHAAITRTVLLNSNRGAPVLSVSAFVITECRQLLFSTAHNFDSVIRNTTTDEVTRNS